MSFTVVPLHNLSLPSDTHIDFGAGFCLRELPEWVKTDSILQHLSLDDRQSIKDSHYALVSEYQAASIGEHDPEWNGKEPKSIQSRKFEAAMLANLALWLVQPSTVCFTSVVHAISWAIPGQPDKHPIIQQIERHDPLYCHPDDLLKRVSTDQVVAAGKLHAVLCSIPRKNAMWTAMRAFWAALTMHARDLRYSFFWIGLEALFGPDNNGGEITYKLSQRIAFFISATPEEAQDTFRKARICYGTRSQIVHGRWEDTPKMDLVMGHTEFIMRSAFMALLNDQGLIQTFLSNQRDKYLEDHVFFRALPPTPPR